MNRVDLSNAAAVVGALVLSMLAVGIRPGRGEAPAPAAATEEALVDATGTRLPPGDYRRIASATSIADRLLLELCDPTRILAVTATSAEGPRGYRYQGKAPIRSLDRLEALLELDPDVVVVSNVGDPRRVARLREAGLSVFDLGAPSSWASLQAMTLDLATLCGDRARGEEVWRRLDARARSIAPPMADEARPAAIYLATYGGRLYGGTTGSSYHDVIELAGLRDAAAKDYRGFPQYSVEQLLALDPPTIVTKEGQAAALCGRDELAPLTACRQDQVVEIEGTILDDPGLGILDAATALREAVFGEGEDTR